MRVRLHHAHIFSSDIDAAIRFWQDMFGAEVQFDMEAAGARVPLRGEVINVITFLSSNPLMALSLTRSQKIADPIPWPPTHCSYLAVGMVDIFLRVRSTLKILPA